MYNPHLSCRGSGVVRFTIEIYRVRKWWWDKRVRFVQRTYYHGGPRSKGYRVGRRCRTNRLYYGKITLMINHGGGNRVTRYAYSRYIRCRYGG